MTSSRESLERICKDLQETVLEMALSVLDLQERTKSLDLIRQLRNACTCEENASLVWEYGMIGWLGQYCQQLVMSSSTHHDPHTKKLFVTSLMQFLSNYAACGAHFSVSLWNVKKDVNVSVGVPFGEVGYRNAMAAAMTVGSRLAVAAVIASMYNSYVKIEAEYDQDILDQCLQTLSSSRGLCSQLMLSVPDAAHLAIKSLSSDNRTESLTTTTTTTSSSSETTGDSDTISASPPKPDPLFEWMHRLFFYLLQHRRLFQIFVTLQPRAVGESLWEDGLLDSCATSDTDIDINRMPSSSHRLTHEQIIFLQLLRDVLEDNECMEQLCKQKDVSGSMKGLSLYDKDASNNGNSTSDEMVSEECLSGERTSSSVEKTCRVHDASTVLWELLHRIAHVACQLHSDAVDARSINSTSTKASLSAQKSMELLCLSTVGAGIAALSKHTGTSLRSSLATTTAILSLCHDCLQQNNQRRNQAATQRLQQKNGKRNVGNPADRISKASKEDEQQQGQQQEEEEELLAIEQEIVKVVLQIVGNLCYGCSSVQDLMMCESQDLYPLPVTTMSVAESENQPPPPPPPPTPTTQTRTNANARSSGVPLLATVLSHCTTDFDLPLAREWALLCVRNACEGHRNNQQFIEELKPQQVIQDDVLGAQGVSVGIDVNTGKFTYQQQATPTST